MINLQKVIFQTAKFNAVNVVSVLIQIPTQIIIGIYLLPEEFGVISLVGLWSLYSGLINPGMLPAGQREIPYLIGANKVEKSLKVQNIAVSSDFLYSLLPFFVILASSFFYTNKMIKIGMIITSFYFLTNRIPTYWSSINFVKQNFTVVAFGKLISAVMAPIAIICLISYLGVYAVLIAPLIGAVLAGIYYLIKGPIDYHFQFEWKEVVRLINVGFVLSLSGIIFYGYKMADSTIIASFLPLSDLGLFSYAMGLILFGINFLSDFGRVLEPIIWEHSGKINIPEKSFHNTKNMAVYIALFTAAAIPAVQICYGILVEYIVPRYIESLPVFMILSLMLYLATMPIIPNIILNSVVVNKQRVVAIVYLIGLTINIIFDLIMVKTGLGIKSIALVTAGSQGMITLILFAFAFRYILTEESSRITYILQLVVPIAISGLFTFSHYYLGNDIFKNPTEICLSLFSQIIVWSFILLVFYREYFPKNLLNDFARKLKINK